MPHLNIWANLYINYMIFEWSSIILNVTEFYNWIWGSSRAYRLLTVPNICAMYIIPLLQMCYYWRPLWLVFPLRWPQDLIVSQRMPACSYHRRWPETSGMSMDRRSRRRHSSQPLSRPAGDQTYISICRNLKQGKGMFNLRRKLKNVTFIPSYKNSTKCYQRPWSK